MFALALSTALPVVAQNAPVTPAAKPEIKCPIQYKSLMHGKDTTKGSYVDFRFTNTSDKTISSSQFGIVVFDPTGHRKDYVRTVGNTQEVKPGKGGKISEETSIEVTGKVKADDPQHSNGVQVYIIKISFSDGTSWVDDGSKACVSTVE
jgi:hypothetical protein